MLFCFSSNCTINSEMTFLPGQDCCRSLRRAHAEEIKAEVWPLWSIDKCPRSCTAKMPTSQLPLRAKLSKKCNQIEQLASRVSSKLEEGDYKGAVRLAFSEEVIGEHNSQTFACIITIIIIVIIIYPLYINCLLYYYYYSYHYHLSTVNLYFMLRLYFDFWC